jgi:tetratricopeptide (TPR) repeat protein
MTIMESHAISARGGSSRSPDAGVTVALALGLLCAAILSRLAWRSDLAPFPFIWRDVALVQFLAALPIATTLAVLIRRQVARASAAVLATLAFGVVALVMAITLPFDFAAPPQFLLVTGGVLRDLISLGLATAVMLGAAAYARRPPIARYENELRHVAAVLVLEMIALLLVPSVYIRARCRHDANRVADLIEQSRLGEAFALVQRLLVLSPQAEWNGHPLDQALPGIEQSIRDIQSRVSIPLSVQATDQQRVDRARDLAVLGNARDALDVLQSSPASADSPDACNLRGTIHETRGEWELGRQSYQRAKLAWQSQPPGPERAAGLVRATTGIAYCLRKLGRYADAETFYLEVLSLSPTADSHFLLARFYDDTEQTAKAHSHARQAMALASERYQLEGQQLIDKLAMRHFGCLGIFTSDHSASDAVSATK